MFRTATAIALAVASAAQQVSAQAFTRMINFGDSLSDVGNTSSQTFGISPGSNYYSGRYSNGPVWVEPLATFLNLPAVTKSRSGGLDYATGGTHTGGGYQVPDPFGIIKLPNAGTQIEDFLSHSTLGANDLVTVWAGANDLFDANTLDPSVPANNVRDHVQRLVGAGARNILVVNLPPLGETPRYNTTADRSAMTRRAGLYNVALTGGLDAVASSNPGATIYRFDVFGLFRSALGDPSAYGFTNVTSPALNSDSGAVVPNPDQYLFYDNIHPTRAGHNVIATNAFEVVTARSVAATTIGATLDWNTAGAWTQKRVPDSTSAITLLSGTPTLLSLTGSAAVRKLNAGFGGVGIPVGGLGSQTLQLNSGTLFVSSAAAFSRSAILAGRGTLASSATFGSGATLSPGVGDGAPAAVGQINFSGDLTLTGGLVRVDLADAISDRIVVGGVARLDGTLGVRFVNGYTGLPGNSYAVMNYASKVGAFAITNETGRAGLRIIPTYGATTLTLALDATLGDATLDSIVNFDDLVILAQNYNAISDATWLTGDFTYDGRVNFDDLVPLAQNYNTTSPGAFAADWQFAQALAPEPAALLAAIVSTAFVAGRRRAR